MPLKKILLWIVAIDFAALSTYAVVQQGYMAFYENVFGSPIGVQLGTDLLIALALALIWMFHDAREWGISFWPFLALTAVLGSLGPIAYLIRREYALAPTPVRQTATAN